MARGAGRTVGGGGGSAAPGAGCTINCTHPVKITLKRSQIIDIQQPRFKAKILHIACCILHIAYCMLHVAPSPSPKIDFNQPQHNLCDSNKTKTKIKSTTKSTVHKDQRAATATSVEERRPRPRPQSPSPSPVPSQAQREMEDFTSSFRLALASFFDLAETCGKPRFRLENRFL